MVLNKDFREFIQSLNDNKVRYLVVGGYAVGFHGYPRYTKDLDIWIACDRKNAERIIQALRDFGFDSAGLKASDFLAKNEFVQLGYPPNRIDIITSCEGLDFDECYSKKIEINVEGLNADFIDLDSLVRNKKTVGKPQDIADLDNLKPEKRARKKKK